MLKIELENRLGYEVTQEGFLELEKMYMACSLDKDSFAAMVKSGAKVYKVERQPKLVTFSYGEVTPNGCWYSKVKQGELVDINVSTGMVIVKNVRYYNGDGLSYYKPDYFEWHVVVKN